METAQVPLNRAPTATEVGFRIAPRINAAGRMDVAGDVVELFLTREPERAKELAEKLNRLNDDRRATEAKALEAIEARLEKMRGPDGEFLAECMVLDDPDWHRGVLGILASRVVDRTGRPALVLMHEDGQAHGSGRSIAGFHLLDALTAVHEDGLFTRFGGHAHAVGFALPSEQIETLRARLGSYGLPLAGASLLTTAPECDADVPFNELTDDLLNWLERCGPFGVGNREPVWLTRDLTLAAPIRLIKERHVCLELQQEGAPRRLSALGWSRNIDWPARCAELGLEQGSRVDIVYRLRAKANPQFPGLELELVDLRMA
jgi:single-stranded-DNA-specific exonuclease